MIYRPLAVLSVLLLIGAAALADDLDATLRSAMSGTKVPGMGILLLRDGKVSYVAVRGVRRNDGSDPVRLSDVWHIGSDAKAMTATMIARLVDRGVLRWDTPLDKMLPDLASGMRPEYRSVTLLQLLSHRAGLPHDVLDTTVFGLVASETASLRQQRLGYITRALQDPPVNQPGTAYSYSNTGYLIAAAIAEQASAESYEDLMRREVFAPLGMGSIGFGVTHDGQNRGHFAGRVVTSEEGNPAFFGPAGNIYLTLDDWAKFCLDQMAGAEGHGGLLETDSYRLMQTPVAGSSSGLGWGVLSTAMGRAGPVLAHAGSDGTWYAEAVLFPKAQSGVLVTANAGEDMGGEKADRAAIKAVIDSLAPRAP